MNAKERAENIRKTLMPLVDLGPSIVDSIADQIEEAEREAENKLKAHWFGPTETDWGEGIKAQGYAEGFRAAREKAAGIANSHAKDYVLSFKTVGDEIRQMEGK